MSFRRRLANFNRHVTNPIQRNWAWRLPPWVMVLHRGRRSGRTYFTPVMGRVKRDQVVLPILYGEQSDWVRNVLAAGGGAVTRSGVTHAISAPRIEERGRGKALVADLGAEIARGNPRDLTLDA